MIDIHPMAPRQGKAPFRVRDGKQWAAPGRILDAGAVVLACDSWVKAYGLDNLQPYEEWLKEQEAKAAEPEPVETEAPAANVKDGRTKKARSPRRK